MAQVIIGTVLEGYDFSGNPPLTPVGFEYGTSQYAFLHAGGSTTPNSDGKIHSFKSTDDGATWNEQDTGNAPLIGLNYSPGHCICKDGTLVYVMYVRSTAGVIDGLSVITYNLSTDLWAATATDYFPLPHAAPNCPELGYLRTAATPTIHLLQLCLVRRAPGDMILYYPGPNEPLIPSPPSLYQSRVYYATFDGSTFGTGIELPNQVGDSSFFFPAAAAVGQNGVTHFFYTTIERVGHPGFDGWHISMDGGGSFGTPELITDSGYLGHTVGTFSAPIVFTTGGHEYIAFAGLINDNLAATTQSERLFYARTAVDTSALTWHSSTISTGVYGDVTPEVLFWEFSQVQAVSITLTFQAGVVVVAYTWTPANGGPGWIDGIAYTYVAQASFGGSWTTPAIAIAGSQSFFEPAQTCSWAMPTSGRVGVLTFSVGIGSPTTDQEVAEFNSLVPSAPVLSGNRYRAFYQ